jgi:hypothetical protein
MDYNDEILETSDPSEAIITKITRELQTRVCTGGIMNMCNILQAP